jgi:D-sedoheptulose 7-phosphate isomerase
MYLQNLQKTIGMLKSKDLDNLYKLIKKKISKNKKIYIFGNGGSATTAQHFVTDWNKMYLIHKKKRINGYCLNENIGILTAYSNDISYDIIFSKQLETLMDKGDLAIGITTSGKSKNIVNAYKAAKKIGGEFYVLTNQKGGYFKNLKKNILRVPTTDTQVCEDVHLIIGHYIVKRLIK